MYIKCVPLSHIFIPNNSLPNFARFHLCWKLRDTFFMPDLFPLSLLNWSLKIGNQIYTNGEEKNCIEIKLLILIF